METNGHLTANGIVPPFGFSLLSDVGVSGSPILPNRSRSFLTNEYPSSISRFSLASRLFDRRRDINDECGYPKTSTITPEAYQDLYEREAIAARVVEVIPKECWQTQPSVYEEEDADQITEFEKAWDTLGNGLRGKDSYYQDEEGSPIWDYLCRLNIQSRIGSYGILLFGFDDGKELNTPVVQGKGMELLYLRVFPEALARISQFEADTSSPRFGQPNMYTVTFNNPNDNHSGTGVVLATREVHWSRVLHFADNLESSEIYGVPAMRPVLNSLLALQKLYGCSAEMYYKGAFPGISLETDPSLGGDVTIDPTAIKNMIESYQNGLQRYLTLTGLSANSLAPQVVDPTPQITVHLEAISIKLGIPMRVFKGSERGELASSQDDTDWNERKKEYQCYCLTPRLIIPFVDRLIQLGILPEPKGFSVWWPGIDSQTEAEKTDIAVKKTQAITTYTQGGGEALVPPLDYLTTFLGMDEEEAQAILDNAAAILEGEGDDADVTGSALLSLPAGMTGMVEMFKLAREGALSEEQLKQLIMLFFKISEDKADDLIADGLTEAAISAGEEPIAGAVEVEEDTGFPPSAIKEDPFSFNSMYDWTPITREDTRELSTQLLP